MERRLVVVFDICSSTTILEELKRTDNLTAWRNFLISIKDFLQREGEKLGMELYKFIGDGWVLLFPDSVPRVEFCFFLEQLSSWFDGQFETTVSPVLTYQPDPVGLMFGIDAGDLVRLEMDQGIEYLGRAINVAARLQAKTKELPGGPSYKALFSKNSLNSPQPRPPEILVKAIRVELRNITPSRIDSLVFKTLETFRKNRRPSGTSAKKGSHAKKKKKKSDRLFKKSTGRKHFEAWNKAQEIWTRPGFRDLRGKVFERLRNSTVPWTGQDIEDAKEVARTIDEFAHLSQFMSKDLMIDTWDDPLAKAWIVLEPIVRAERAKQDWAKKWDMFETLGEAALAKLVREGRDPLRELRLGEVAFDYLPASPLEHGWVLVDTTSLPRFSRNEKNGLTISAKERSGLDYEVRPPGGMSGRVHLKARYSANAVFYLKVRMAARKDGGSKFGWLAFRLGNGSPKQESHDEWIIYASDSGTDGWIPLNLSLPYHVAETFGKDQGLSYQELVAVRLRESISISPIRFFR